jgi:alkyldihydroxyacetonephosphate synthase
VPAAVGPSLRQLLVGSEGVLGVIARARLSLHPLPERRGLATLFFRRWSEGLEAVRELMHRGPRPTMVRLSDPEETRGLLAGAHRPASLFEALKRRLGLAWLEHRAGPGESPCLMMLDFEGSAREAKSACSRAVSRLRPHALLVGGEGPARSWLGERFRHPYLRDDLLGRGILVETFETATTWSGLGRLYDGVREQVARAFAAAGTPGMLFCHLSHAYPVGASLYFSILARAIAGEEPRQWQALKSAATGELVRQGAALSHHHGIGLDHLPWMQAQLGEQALALLRSAKAELDPQDVLNPGKLIPAKANSANSGHTPKPN